MSFVGPVSTFQEDVAYCLAFVTALAFSGVGLVDGMEVGAQADFAGAHLRDNRADRSVCSSMYSECSLPWPHAKSEELSAVFSLFPGQLPLVSHRLTDDGFRSCCQDLE